MVRSGAGAGGKDPGVWRVDSVHGIGQCAWCLITTPHGDKVLETRFLSNDFIICTKNSSASPKVTGSKEHDPKDKETCWPDGTFINLLEIKIGITNCSGDYGNLTSYSLHPQTLWFKTMTPLILLTDLERGKAQQGSHISAPLLFLGDWGLESSEFCTRTQLAAKTLESLLATKFHVASACDLVFLQQVGWVPREPTLGSHLVSTAWGCYKGPRRCKGREHSPHCSVREVSEAVCMKSMGLKRHIGVATFGRYNLWLFYEPPRWTTTRMIFPKCKYHHITPTVLKMPWLTHIQGLTDVIPIFSLTLPIPNLQPFRAPCNFADSLVYPLPRESFLLCFSLFTLSHALL